MPAPDAPLVEWSGNPSACLVEFCAPSRAGSESNH